MKKNLITIALLALLTSCANPKVIEIDGKKVTVEPYGWANELAVKNDSVVYQVSAGNVVWSIIGVETVIAPVWLTGYYLYEPVRKK